VVCLSFCGVFSDAGSYRCVCGGGSYQCLWGGRGTQNRHANLAYTYMYTIASITCQHVQVEQYSTATVRVVPVKVRVSDSVKPSQ
jgi:hypothetical protein